MRVASKAPEVRNLSLRASTGSIRDRQARLQRRAPRGLSAPPEARQGQGPRRPQPDRGEAAGGGCRATGIRICVSGVFGDLGDEIEKVARIAVA